MTRFFFYKNLLFLLFQNSINKTDDRILQNLLPE